MKEIEVKLLDIDRGRLEEDIISMGARKVFDGKIHALFYDFPSSTIKKAKDVMRLRKVGDRAFLTYKKYVEDTHQKVREEYETEVSDYDSTKKILESLGMTVWMEMKKHRTSYELSGARLEFDRHEDQYSFVPEFLEIEASSEEKILEIVTKLGYKKDDCRPWTIIEIAGHYNKRDP